MIRVSFKTHNGHYLIANDASKGYRIGATPLGVGPWEIFTIVPLGRRNDDSLRSGDAIHLQTHHGRYVRAEGGGGGAVNGQSMEAIRWETFTIEKTMGDGEIMQGEQVTLRANNGRNYLMARDGGGGDVSAASTNRADWETFAVEFWNPMLVRFRAHVGHYLTAKKEGGREITATEVYTGIWETFTLANRSRRSGFFSGNKVCLQVWDGKFVSAERGGGGALTATSDRAGEFETFTIQKDGSGEISSRDHVWLQTRNGMNYVMAVNGGGGIVRASSTQAREWERFQLQAAAENPISFSNAPSLSPGAHTGHPLSSTQPRLSKNLKLICFLIGFEGEDKKVDDSITREDLKSFFFGETRSIRGWLRTNSYGAYTISDAGSFAAITVPWPYVKKSDQEYFTGLLRLAEEQDRHRRRSEQFMFSNLASGHPTVLPGNRLLTGEELLFVIVDCTNEVGGGQHEAVCFTYDGVFYLGGKVTAGIYAKGGPLRGRDQLENVWGTITHELSHMLFNLPDRYYAPSPPRGDVVATSQDQAEWETFTVVRPDSLVLRSGDRVRLQLADGLDYLVFDNSDKRYLNRGGTGRERSAQFIIEKAGGGDSISHNQEIHLKSVATGRYVMAHGGGGDVVQVIAESPGPWETFTVERKAGVGALLPFDQINLKTSNNNVYGRSFYLMAEPNRRKTDAVTMSRGWWETGSAGDGAGGDYDIMDHDKDRGMLSAYDRIKMGWIVPKVLTPDYKAWYELRLSIHVPEAFILWDPAVPDEWYVIEYRERTEGLDEIPSSGLIISWVNQNTSYWSRWGHNGEGKFPAVISAAAPDAPPNCFIKLVLLREEFYKRSNAQTAFRSGTYVLPRGDGSPSRFQLSFKELPSGRVAFRVL